MVNSTQASAQTHPTTVDDFRRIVEDFQASESFKPALVWSIGRRVITTNGVHASTRYPVVNGPGQNLGTLAILMKVLGLSPEGVQNVELTHDTLVEILEYFAPFENDGAVHLNIQALKTARDFLAEEGNKNEVVVATCIFDNVAPQGVDDSTLKLYALSLRFFKPNQLNLKGIFSILPTVAWLGDLPLDLDEVDRALMEAAFDTFGDASVFVPHSVDKFPLYIHRVNAMSMGVRITDQHKVRLGAYLGEGTTVMPGASFVNFNAGTEGPAMVEGRISSSAFVGSGSDIGGGASILGTLSGGNDTPIYIGRNCLLEVNCSLGIPVGDAVIITAETAVMSSSRVRVGIEGHHLLGQTVKASVLAGINAVTFRRNHDDGVLEVVRTPRNIEFARKLENEESILSLELHQGSSQV